MPNRDGRFHSLVDETEDDPVTRLDINIDRIASSPAVIRGEHAHTLNSSFTMNGPSYLCNACEMDDNLEEVNYATQVAEMNAREQEDPVTPSVIVQDIIHQQASVDMMRKASAAELRKASATEMSIVHRHQASAVHPPPSTPPPTITVPATSASISSSSPQPADSCLTNENTLSLASSTADPHECHHPPFYQRQHSLRASPASSIRRYDSEMENGWSVQFDIGTFIEEYFVHLFGPLSYPYLAYRYSRAFAANHDLCDPFGRGRGGFWAYCMFVMMNCLFYFYGGSNVVTSSEIVIANAVFLARNCIVACKYAYLSPIQMSTRMKRYLTQDEIGNQLLISGWRKIPYQVQVEEIDHAFCRLGFPESEKSFATFIGHTRQTMIEGLQQNVPDSFIPEDRPDWKSARDKGRLHLRLICQRFVCDAVEAVQYRHMIPVVIIAALIHGTIPCIVRAAQGHSPFGNTWYQVCMIVMSFTISAPNFSANLLFVLVGLIDYRRRIFVMHRCSSLLVDDCPLTGDDTKATMPLLNFTRANNVGVWLELRQVLKDFGKQFFHRVQAYASFWVFTVVCMLGFLFFQLLFQSYAEPTGIILISFDLLTVGVTLFFMLGSAKKLNMIHVDHRKILLQKLSDMQRHISLLTGTDSCAVKYAESVMSAKKMIKVAIQVIETDDELSPVKILGFNANDNLVRALVTAAGSGLIAAGKILADKYRS